MKRSIISLLLVLSLMISQVLFVTSTTVLAEEDQGIISVENPGGSTTDWNIKDIGDLNHSGEVSYENETFTVTAIGKDIWSNNDNFKFTYFEQEGNFTFFAKVKQIQTPARFSKAGIMVRDKLNSTSKNILTAIRGNVGLTTQTRSEEEGNSDSLLHPEDAGEELEPLPEYLKIERYGDYFTSFYSYDGEEWVQWRNTQTVEMGNGVYVGLAVASNAGSEDVSVATFEEVYIILEANEPTNDNIFFETEGIDPSTVEPEVPEAPEELLALEISNTNRTIVPAFPGAEGFGAVSMGGRGGRIIEVTNLNDSGPGSLREALTADGPRTVIFRVGGTINLESGITVLGKNKSYLTVAGQTAPGQGIQISGYGIQFQDCHDITISNLKMRTGETGGTNEDTQVDKQSIMFLGGGEGTTKVKPVFNAIVDHCDMQYSPRDNFGTWGYVYNITLQRSNLAYAVQGTPSFGGKGALIGVTAETGINPFYSAKNISIHHNLFAHNSQRNPSIRTIGKVEVVNNVIYNRGQFGIETDNLTQGTETYLPLQQNHIGNYVIGGESTNYDRYDFVVKVTDPTPSNIIYVQDNIGNRRQQESQDEWDFVGYSGLGPSGEYESYCATPLDPKYQRETPYEMSRFPITINPSSLVVENILNDVGANRVSGNVNFIDDFSNSIIGDVRNGTGSIIDDIYNDRIATGNLGYSLPKLAESNATYTDTNNNGIDDAWEMEYFEELIDANKDYNNNGYTNLEEFLNGTNPIASSATSKDSDASISKNIVKLNGYTTINKEVENNVSGVQVNVYDATGDIVASDTLGNFEANDTITWSWETSLGTVPGQYIVELSADDSTKDEIYVTVIAEEASEEEPEELFITLDGKDTVNGEFTLIYGLNNPEDIKSQEITVKYDPDIFRFLGGEIIANEENAIHEISLLEDKINNDDGKAIFILTNYGEAIDNNCEILELRFQPKESGNGIISIDAEFGQSDGSVIKVTQVDKSIIVSLGIEELESLVSSSKEIYNGAEEGILVGQYPAGAKSSLNSAIEEAEAVIDDPESTGNDYISAYNKLNNALVNFQNLIITETTGDVNNVPGIDIGDLALITVNYGKNSGSVDWDEIKHMDINGDGVIGLYELAFIARRIILKF